MIRSEELLDKLIADLHFHKYLEMTSDDMMNQRRNVVATKDKIDIVQRYIDDVFIDYFFRSQTFKPIIVPKTFYAKRYTKEGLVRVDSDIVLNLNDIYDRYTFVHIVNILFSRSRPDVNGINRNNLFFNGFLLVNKIFAPYCRCPTPILQLPYTHSFDQYLDFKYGKSHSLFAPVFKAQAVKEYGLYYQDNWLNFSMGTTNYSMQVLHNRFKDYIKIKYLHTFGEYTLEDILFLYTILVEKMELHEDNLLSYISLYCESFHSPDNIVNRFDSFEKSHINHCEIEPFILIEDLYLRFTNVKKSKAFKFNPINFEVISIKHFQGKEIKTILSDNTLPLPYFYDNSFINKQL